MSLSEEITNFRVNLTKTLSCLHTIYQTSESLLESPAEEVSLELAKLQDLLLEVSDYHQLSVNYLVEIDQQWGTGQFSTSSTVNRINNQGVSLKSSKKEKSDDFQDLLEYRDKMGFPIAGSEEDNATVAKLQIGDKNYFGVNSSRNPNRRKITLKVNPITRTHAEADVFQQAFDAGIRSDYVKLVVDRDPCQACGLRGGIKGMARQLGVKTLEIVSPSGRQIIQIT